MATKLTSDNLARELLGLPPSGVELPQASAQAFGEGQYGGARMDAAKEFAMTHKKNLMIGGAAVLIALVGIAGYRAYQKHKSQQPSA